MEALTSRLGGLSIGARSLVYLIGKDGDYACYFEWSSDKFVGICCASTLDSFETGRLYWMQEHSAGAIFTELDEEVLDSYINRDRFVYNTRSAYDKWVLHALLLGCRVRDYEQTCAIVTQRSPLVLTTASRPGYLKNARFLTEEGDEFSVIVNNRDYREGEKNMKLFCTPLKRLPDCVVKKSRLQFCVTMDRTPIVTTALGSFYEESREIDNFDVLEQIYGESGAFDHPALSKRRALNISIRRKSAGKSFILNAEQSEAVHRYQSDNCLAFAVESPPGSGKTMTAAAMAVSYKEPYLQLLLSTANVPVFNMAVALADLDYGDKEIVHLVSSNREAMQKNHERSPFSIIDADDFDNYNDLLHLLDKGHQRVLKRKMREEMRRLHERALTDIDDCDIILATVDMILAQLLKKKDPRKTCPIQEQLESHVRRVIIDEASQMTEAALNAIILCFPDAQIVLIGDSKQLPPFRYTKGETISEMAASSALTVLKRRANVPVITLRLVYRAAPSLTEHYSDVFYEGKLVSLKTESTRVKLTSICKTVTGRCLFVDVKNSDTTQSGTSKINEPEICALEYVVNKLRGAGYGKESVMIIAYYDAQRRLAETRLPDGYEVLTVDSAQGREKDIVIVLTTRDSTTTTPFFTCPLRCNVAVSRQKEALIVLGCKSLLKTNTWKKVIQKEYFEHITY